MKKIYPLISLLIISLFSIQLAFSQIISTVTPSPVPALECTNLNVTVTGSYLCANFSIQSTGSSVVGNTIFVDIDIFAPIICLPAIVPFPPQIVPVGLVPAGTYTLTVRTFQNGVLNQTSSQALTIGTCCSADAIYMASNTSICEGDSVTFTASTFGQDSYDWKLNNVSFSSDSISGQVFNTAGTYNIKLVTVDDGCADSTTQTITVTSYPQLSFPNISPESCPGTMDGTIDLDVSGGTPSFTYSWSNGASTQDISQLSGGTYQVWVMDGNGCDVTDSTTVITGLPVTSDFSASTSTTLCPGDTVDFTNLSQGGMTYDWLVNGQSFAQTMGASYTFSNTGTFVISLLASNTTCTDTNTLTFNVIAPAIAPAVTDENCDDAGNGAISLMLSGGTAPYTASWSTGATTTDIDNLDDGMYIVWVTDNMSCITADTITVGTDNITPTIGSSVTDESCTGAGNGMISLMLSGGVAPYTVNWAGGSMATSLDSLDDGTYMVTVTDSLGCESTDMILVGTAPGFDATFMADTATEVCPGTNISFTNTSTVGISYEWLNADTVFATSTDSDFTFEESGNYQIVLVAIDGVCIDSADLEVLVFDLPEILDTLTHPSCPGDVDGKIDLTLNGGAMPFTYNWSTGSTLEDINDLGEGTYTVEIGDNNGCTTADTFELVTQGGLDAAFTWNYQADSTLQFVDGSDSTAVSWSWDFGDGSGTSTDQNPVYFYQFNGTFEVCLSVVDNFGCTDTICNLVDIALSIDKENLHSLKLYPNPTEGKNDDGPYGLCR